MGVAVRRRARHRRWRRSHCRCSGHTCNFLGKPLNPFPSNFTWSMYAHGKMFWQPRWWPSVFLVKAIMPLKRSNYIFPTAQNYSSNHHKTWWVYHHSQDYYIKDEFCEVFFRMFSNVERCFFAVKHSFCHTLGMVGCIGVKRKCFEWNLGQLCYIDHWPWTFKVKIPFQHMKFIRLK